MLPLFVTVPKAPVVKTPNELPRDGTTRIIGDAAPVSESDTHTVSPGCGDVPAVRDDPRSSRFGIDTIPATGNRGAGAIGYAATFDQNDTVVSGARDVASVSHRSGRAGDEDPEPAPVDRSRRIVRERAAIREIDTGATRSARAD